MIYVTDTHALVWWIEGNSRLSATASAALADPRAQVIVPSIVLAEIRFLYARGRILIDLDATLAHIRSAPNYRTHPLDEQVVALLPAGLDIHDGIIVATALLTANTPGQTVALITRDAQITASGVVPVIW
jgi:PIN domain nuclease of toxin-antitoxin system